MSIGELAERTGVVASTLRFWDAEGLLKPVGRTPAGYRRYDSESQARVGFIRRAQALGLSLVEVTELLAAADGEGQNSARGHLRHVVAHKLDEARRQVDQLEAFVGQLERVWYRLEDEGNRCDCRHLGDCACMPPSIDGTDQSRLRAELGAVAGCECGCGQVS